MLNEMMERRIVLPSIVEYMRSSQRRFYKELDDLERKCNEKRVPIIPHETAVFLDFQIDLLKPKKILEIGTAVGFSSILMASNMDESGKVVTIERSPHMYPIAEKNIKKFGMEDKIELVIADAMDFLPKLDDMFDFIFMDSAKAKYIDFFPHCMRVLDINGVLMVDDIFQGGTVLDDIKDIPRRVKTIHKKLNMFLDFVQNDDSLKTTLLPLGDGVILIKKVKDKDYSYLTDEIK